MATQQEIWVPTFPNAERRANDFKEVVNNLTEHRNKICTTINEAESKVGGADLESTDLSGAYYDEFVSATDSWKADFRRVHDNFGVFLRDLDRVITNAERMESLWRSRIDLGRYVDMF